MTTSSEDLSAGLVVSCGGKARRSGVRGDDDG
jgi:hypothetical protein